MDALVGTAIVAPRRSSKAERSSNPIAGRSGPRSAAAAARDVALENSSITSCVNMIDMGRGTKGDTNATA